MHKIVLKKQLSHDMFWIEFEAPFVAKKAKPGQFIIFRGKSSDHHGGNQ